MDVIALRRVRLRSVKLQMHDGVDRLKGKSTQRENRSLQVSTGAMMLDTVNVQSANDRSDQLN